MILPI